MKKRKLNSKKPKYLPIEDKKDEQVEKKLISQKGKVKVYAVFKNQ